MKSDNSKLPTPQIDGGDIPEGYNLDQKPHRLGWITIFVMFGLLGTWAFLAQIETSVGANGTVITKGYKKMIQHPRGGVITKLYVEEGDSVKKGSPLIALDNTAIVTQLNSAISQFDSELFKKVRLEAQGRLSKSVNFDSVRSKMFNKPLFQSMKEQNEALFKSNIDSLDLRVILLKDRNRILKEQISGLEMTISSNKKQLNSYIKELKKWQNLYDRNMTDELKVLERERKIEQISVSIEQAESKIRENLATIEANKNQIKLERTSFINGSQKELFDTIQRLTLLKEQIVSLQNAKERLLIKAPDDGTIVNMLVHTEGEVVVGNKPIAYVVPENSKMIIEAFVVPTDIDKVRKGLSAEIHFPSYVDPAAKPIEGNVTYVSADAIEVPHSRVPLYKILIDITPKGEKAIKENGFEIVPGMPAAAMIKAGRRSFMSYILLPLESLIKGAFHAN
jgi:epimerase transport system membrane fusion protein